LTENGVEFERVDYLKERLSSKELGQLLERAGLKPQDAIRKGEAAYGEYVAGKNLSDAQLVRVMAEHPELIQRPLVVRGEKVVLARPVERLGKLGIG
jgi:arsenate reductase (glutaredoxin)